MKRFIRLITLWFSVLFAHSLWSMEMEPDRLVDRTVREVIDIIEHDEKLKSGDKKKMLDLIENKILPHFDFTRMTRLVMGKHWSSATSDQQTELVNQFQDLLVRTYSNALTTYSDETVQVKPVKNLGDKTDVTVRTVVIQGSGKQPVPIDYSMQKGSGGWKIYDVTVAGVSLVTNYRGSFSSQIRKGGVEGLIKTLSEKNRALEKR